MRILARATVLIVVLLAIASVVEAQQTRAYRIGVVLQGGPYSVAVDGLREGLRELGFEEGKQYTLHVHDTRGDLKAVEPAARDLERDSVDLIYSVTTTVTLATRRATKRVPIVFYAGADPVAMGLVESFPKRRVASVEELRASLRSLRLGEADALVYVADAMVTSQTGAIIDAARIKKLPTMFQEGASVAMGALASYGISLHAAGRLSAKQVQRILQGAAPGDLPVEQLARPHFALNLKTAKELGLTIPTAVLVRADEVIR